MTQTVLITGASTGFGKATALYFASQGWQVIASMRNPAAGADLARHDNILVTRLDVQDTDSIAAAITTAVQRFGTVDAVVNNAGFGLFGLFEATSREKIQEQFDVNVFGMMDVIRAILPHFRARGTGTIVNISSGAGVYGLPMISLYNASKFALEGFSESLSYELGSQGITVKIVEPGGVLDTKFGERSANEFGMARIPPGYEGFMEAARKFFDGLRAQRLATAEEVARGIFDATTDGTDRLRYVVTDDIKPPIKARRESSEEEYMAFMRGNFRS